MVQPVRGNGGDPRLRALARDEGEPALAQPAARLTFLSEVGARIDYAFQPIVNVHTGSVYGYEGLLRGYQALGFGEIEELFDFSHARGLLHSVDQLLRERAVERFVTLPGSAQGRLFFNLDTRILALEGERDDRSADLLERHGMRPEQLCFELSELHDLCSAPRAGAALSRLRKQRHLLAIDDFGTGFSGLKLLYEYPTDLIKIDRFFIAGVAQDHRKRLFVGNTVELAHVMGISVVAEGVETERELLVCRDLGVDLVQGRFVAAPSTNVEAMAERYPIVETIARHSRSTDRRDSDIIRARIEPVPPLVLGTSMHRVYDHFRRHKDRTVFPVLDRDRQPLGLIHEVDLKDLIYSDYGRDLLQNRAYSRSLATFVRRCPVADVNIGAERVLELYAASDQAPGVVIVDDFRYVGFLSADSLLRVIDEKNLAFARDQNPLTRLPGNNMIVDYLTRLLADAERDFLLAYFDFDHFKPFNDKYGFRQGDRAITLFADLMHKHLGNEGVFHGHIGGDDFFTGFSEPRVVEVLPRVRGLLAAFARDVESFYSGEDRARGHLMARDRDGELRPFPLLSCTASVIEIPAGRKPGGIDELSARIAALKRQAKLAGESLIVDCI